MREEIEAVLNEHVRPQLRAHGGDLEVLEVADGIVRFKLMGQCAGCPAADLTTEELIQTELTERVPGVTQAVLVQSISDDLIAQAKAILRGSHGG